MSGDQLNLDHIERPRGVDMRLPGESFCTDCPDHEACATGYPCDFVRSVARDAADRRP